MGTNGICETVRGAEGLHLQVNGKAVSDSGAWGVLMFARVKTMLPKSILNTAIVVVALSVGVACGEEADGPDVSTAGDDSDDAGTEVSTADDDVADDDVADDDVTDDDVADDDDDADDDVTDDDVTDDDVADDDVTDDDVADDDDDADDDVTDDDVTDDDVTDDDVADDDVTDDDVADDDVTDDDVTDDDVADDDVADDDVTDDDVADDDATDDDVADDDVTDDDVADDDVADDDVADDDVTDDDVADDDVADDDVADDDDVGLPGSGEACTVDPSCSEGATCYEGICVQAGSGLRLSVSWEALADLDLHVIAPNGDEIWWDEPVGGGGVLDVDDCLYDGMFYCVDAVGTHVESVFFEAPEPGDYVVLVYGYETSGVTVDFTLRVFLDDLEVETVDGSVGTDEAVETTFTNP